MAVYYIDFLNGDDSLDGLSPSNAKKDHTLIDVKAGDSLLFKRGGILRGRLTLCEGTEDKPIYYGAYGEGEAPIICGSVSLSSPELWRATEREFVWECLASINGDVGNFLLNGESVATLRWSSEELCSEGDFFDSRFADGEQRHRRYSKQKVLFYSQKNPAEAYENIECISYSTRALGVLCSNIIIEDIAFKNIGVHALAGQGKNIKIRRCSFENIGGCAWNNNLKIRFGNGIEFWNYAENVLIEECSFKNIYDSCVTHQGGGEELRPAKNFICRKNIFDTYGMAALELRDVVARGFFFEKNVCINAGCGFAMLGEKTPRSSEIWPQPMGHHVFLWRMEGATEGGCVQISENEFGRAPVGAAIYSIIAPEAEAQFKIEGNKYIADGGLLIRFNGENFTDITDCARATKIEKNLLCYNLEKTTKI